MNYSEIRGENKPNLGNPISLLYSVLGKHARYLRMVEKIKQEDIIQSRIFRKYNPQIVGRVIGSEDEAFVKEFMSFCNLSDEYLLEVVDIELYMNLLIRYTEFLEKLDL